MPAQIYVGTSSWNSKSVIECGRFYPPGLKDASGRLSFYAQHFNLAELDSTYYALPSRRNTQRWAAAVPSEFRFNVKAFSLFSQHPTKLTAIPKSFHQALKPEVRQKPLLYYKDVPSEVSDELWRIFRGALDPLRQAGVLGTILVDFPPWFVPTDANRAHIGHVRERLPDDNILVEFRNSLWVADEATAGSTFSLLRDLGCGFVCVDEPLGLKSSFPPVVAVTAKVASVRFRGRNVQRWEDKSSSTEERLSWWYSDAELTPWLPRIQQLAAHSDAVYLSFSTKEEDQGVANAGRLQHLLKIPA